MRVLETSSHRQIQVETGNSTCLWLVRQGPAVGTKVPGVRADAVWFVDSSVVVLEINNGSTVRGHGSPR